MQRGCELNQRRGQGEVEARDERDAIIPSPRGRMDVARRIPPGGGGRIVSAMELAAALQDEPSEEVEARWRLLKVAGAAPDRPGAGTAGMFHFKPEYRAPTRAWVTDKWQMIKDELASIEWSGKSSPTPTVTPPRGCQHQHRSR